MKTLEKSWKNRKKNLFTEVAQTFESSVKPEYFQFLPLESLTMYTEFTSETVNHLNTINISYTKVRQFKILDKMVLETIDTIQKKLSIFTKPLRILF